MSYCETCKKETNSGQFCDACGKQLVTAVSESASEIAANTSVSNQAMWANLAPALLVIIGYFTLFFPWALLWLPGLLIKNSATATEFDRRHAIASLNYQLTALAVVGIFVIGDIVLLLGLFVGSISAFYYILLPYALITLAIVLIHQIVGVVISIVASVSAANLKDFRYPLSYRFVK